MTEESAVSSVNQSDNKKRYHPYTHTFKVTSTVGGIFPNINPIFTPDKLYFIVLTSLELRVYSRATKQIIRSFALDDVYEINDIELDGDNDSLIRIIRSTGKLEIINWQDKNVDKEVIDLKFHFNRFISKEGDDRFIVYREKEGIVVVKKKDEDGGWEKSNMIKLKSHNFAISNSKQYVALYTESMKEDMFTVTVVKFDGAKTKIVNHKPIKRYRPVTSLAISDDGLLAVGSYTGVIDLYHDIFGENGYSMRSLKWHIDSVLALTFSLNDSYLISGGKERVLVFWQLATDNTQFLPRLEGDINDIYVDPNSELYAVSLQGDQIVVLSSIDLLSRFQVSGIKTIFSDKFSIHPDKERKKFKNKNYRQCNVGDCTTNYYINPQTKHGYFPTQNTSQVQIYDLIKDEQISVFTTASTIQTGKVRSENLIEDPVITHIKFSNDGKYMLTVDEQKSPSLDKLLSKDDKEINLKFWGNKNNNENWQLLTRVSSPHGLNKSIIDAIPINSEHGFITVSEDGGIKLWKPTSNSWSIRKFIAPNAMTSTAVSIALSSDNSVLILAYESTLKLFDGNKFQILRTLPNILGSRVRHLQIVGTKLVALSKTRLLVWDLLINRQIWSIQLHSITNGKRLLAIDPINERIALAINYYHKSFKIYSKLFIFKTDLPIPLFHQTYHFGISAINHIPGTENFSFINVYGCISQLSYDIKGLKSAPTIGTSINNEISKDNGIYSLYETQRRNNDITRDLDINTSIYDNVLNIHSFDKVFDDAMNITSLESLMNGVLSIVSPRVK